MHIDPHAQGEPRAYGVSVEHEPIGEHLTRPTLTLLLTARRCPVECVFCDLWRHNHAEPTPRGSIPQQIAAAIDSLSSPVSSWSIKLYNGGNFTDPQSIPPADWPAIAELCDPFERVIVENHATMCGDRLLRFHDLLRSKLEVAIGLETSDPNVLARQKKKMTLEDFAQAAEFLRGNDITLRCFVMLQLPYADPERCVGDAVRAVQHAADAGAGFVAIIPTRSDTVEMQQIVASGEFVPPRLRQLETALRESLAWGHAQRLHCVVTADTWDIETVRHCPDCQASRIANIEKMNLTQQPRPLTRCSCR
ncbi:radical SAM protein [Allorhodopirellula solitaria]|uniref:Elp3/MiaA/NifB-like radical SAM core domain-containing protein n=1 Tax=Allorhodopirellula solitaria TaxID=2527987 RepID=A0A5C5XBG9_9BACT|nr:radical SAM protein [Allorhodopirellula solitaria]TWT59262.1 hypothetical protein CA85_39580 [Allorhodopirellula solitaria]